MVHAVVVVVVDAEEVKGESGGQGWNGLRRRRRIDVDGNVRFGMSLSSRAAELEASM